MRCPNCGKIFPSNYYKCNTCNKPLVSEEEYRKLKANPNAPKCPTCSSTNIEKISSFDKAAGAVMFGLFSKTARSQFKCRNCGYKW